MEQLLTVADTAAILRVHPRTVMNMARRGELPGTKIGKQWRFDRLSIEEWLTQKINGSQARRASVAAIHFSIPSVSNLLSESAIRRVANLETGQELLEILAALIARTCKLPNYTELLDALAEREEMHSTAMGGGIAFPHPRNPLGDVSSPAMAVLIVDSGVEFGAPDDELTYLFICMCAPDDRSHVTLLGRLAHMFRSDGAVQRVRECLEPAQVINQFRKLETVPHDRRERNK